MAFSREAVRRSIVEAAVRKYDPDRIHQLIDSVIADVYPMAKAGVVPSSTIAESVLRHFREFDEVSQIRFALVHMGRQDRSDNRPGWNSADQVRSWLADEYAQLRYHRPVTRLSEILKRDGSYEEFDPAKLRRGIEIAAKGRISELAVSQLATAVLSDVEGALGDQPMVTSGQIASEILRSLRHRDPIAYLRFASTAKQFRHPEDYYNEVEALRDLG